MIKLLEKDTVEAARSYCEGDPFGCRILAALLAYGIDKPFAQFWAQYDESGSITAVFCRLDTAMTVCAKGDYDTEEADSFVQANMGYMGALRPARQGESANGLVMRLTENKITESTADVEMNPEISDVYAVMEECATALLTICACVPEHRRQGYTRKVVNALLERNPDCDIYLMCMPALHDFYRQFGFVTIGGFVY